jgi:hypothetical protein
MKPAEQTSTTAKLVTEIFEDVGVPDGVLNVVFGEGESVGARLVNHPDVDALSFTGSTEVDLDEIEETRRTWQFYRDRRPETYGELASLENSRARRNEHHRSDGSRETVAEVA